MAAKAKAVEAAGDTEPAFQPLRLKAPGKNEQNGHEDKRVPLFYVGDREYTMLAEPRTNLALQYLRRLGQYGYDHALDFAFSVMVGPDGYDALLSCDDLTKEQFWQVVKVVRETLLGPLEDPKDS